MCHLTCKDANTRLLIHIYIPRQFSSLRRYCFNDLSSSNNLLSPPHITYIRYDLSTNSSERVLLIYVLKTIIHVSLTTNNHLSPLHITAHTTVRYDSRTSPLTTRSIDERAQIHVLTYNLDASLHYAYITSQQRLLLQ